MENEIWKHIPNYPDYEISNMGRVKSLKFGKERILKLQIDAYGYYHCGLCKDNKPKTVKPHQLVAVAFLNHNINGYSKVVDHKDGNPLNNKLSNLRIVTNRENLTNYRKDLHKQTSQFVGVHIFKVKNKNGKEYSYIKSSIIINGKPIHLGTFKTEEEAHNAYLSRLAIISCLE